jgi:hypothetical protein
MSSTRFTILSRLITMWDGMSPTFQEFVMGVAGLTSDSRSVNKVSLLANAIMTLSPERLAAVHHILHHDDYVNWEQDEESYTPAAPFSRPPSPQYSPVDADAIYYSTQFYSTPNKRPSPPQTPEAPRKRQAVERDDEDGPF